MNQLLKKILIVNLVLLILGALIISSSLLYEQYIKNYPPQPAQYDANGNQLLQTVPKGPYFYIFQGLTYLLIFGFPIFVILMSILYQLKNINFKGYLKSLLIPLSYLIIASILSIIWLFNFVEGEEGMGAVIIWLQLAITFGAVLFINLIIFLIGYSKQKP